MAEPNADATPSSSDEWSIAHPDIVNLFPGMAFLTGVPGYHLHVFRTDGRACKLGR